MSIFKNLSFSLSLLFLLSGCTLKPGLYTPDFNGINELKELNIRPMAVVQPSYQNQWAAYQAVEEIKIRGSKLISPYGGTFAEYLKASLEEHLKSAQLYDKDSDISLSAILLKNEVNANGFIVGKADISANFTLRQDGKIIYEKIHTIHHEWDSSLAAAVAVPNALANYPIAIRKLIDSLMSDKEFIRAVKTK